MHYKSNKFFCGDHEKETMKIKQTSKAAIILTLLIIVGINYALAGWSGPSQPPPNGNTSTPLNTGAETQDKRGVLGVNGMAIFGLLNMQTNQIKNVADPTEGKDAVNRDFLVGYVADYVADYISTVIGGSSGSSNDWVREEDHNTRFDITCEYKFITRIHGSDVELHASYITPRLVWFVGPRWQDHSKVGFNDKNILHMETAGGTGLIEVSVHYPGETYKRGCN